VDREVDHDVSGVHVDDPLGSRPDYPQSVKILGNVCFTCLVSDGFDGRVCVVPDVADHHPRGSIPARAYTFRLIT
jgi:hypothetical protein